MVGVTTASRCHRRPSGGAVSNTSRRARVVRHTGRRSRSKRAGDPARASSEQPATAVEHLRRRRSTASARCTTTSRWTGTVTVPPIPALAPNAMCAVPRIFSSSRMLPVSVARSFVPTPSSARLRPSGPCASSIARYCAASSPLPVAPTSRPSRIVSRTGVLGQADEPERRRGDRALAADRRHEALAAGQVAERAGRAEVALVGDRGAPGEVEPHVGAARAGHAGLVGCRSAARRRRGSGRRARRSRCSSAARACRPSRRAASRRGDRARTRACARSCATATAGTAR